MAILEVSGLKKIYTTRFGGNQVQALSNVSFSVEQGEYVAIMGESGSGKTTLLNILAALDKPTSGKVVLEGKDLSTVREKDVATFRRDNLGFVFQEFNLLDTFSLEDNIFLPLVLAGKSYEEMSERLRPIAETLGITSLLKKYPYEVSGGQKQRAAVARALIIHPRIVLADEPTGSVDRKTADYIFDLFSELNRNGQTILIVTHDIELSKKVNRVVAIRDGKISSESVLKEQYADRVKESGISFLEEDTQDEYVVLDRAGRLQIPSQLLKDLNLEDNKVKVSARGNEIIVSKPE